MKKILGAVFCVVFMLILTTTTNVAAQEQAKGRLTGTFSEKSLGYTISYPGDWKYGFQAPHIVIFSAKKGADGGSVISIRNLNSTKVPGGKYSNADAIIENLMNQLRTAKEALVYDPEPFVYGKGQTKLTGKRLTAEYTIKGTKYKQLVVVLPRATGEVFYVWSFVSPAKSYDTDLAVAQAMLNSWMIQ